MNKAILCWMLGVTAWVGLSAMADEGGKLYQQHCAACHGGEREGGVGPNLADAIWLKVKANQASIAQFIAQGSVALGMPAWKGVLGDEQINSLAKYLLNPGAATKSATPLTGFVLPPGFSISLYSDQTPGARSLAVSAKGIVYAGSRTAGKIYALEDTNGDKLADKITLVASGLDSPQGVTLLDGDLYVAEISRVLRFVQIDKNFASKPRYQIVKDDLPKDKWHGEKIIKAGPDGKLYIPIGAPCNVCNKEDEVYSKIWRMDPDGSHFEEYARGIRNSVGIAWKPDTQEMWFTDNGRDMLGDNLPSCELNYAPHKGMHFGFPYCQGGIVPDPEFGSLHSCSEFTPPAFKVGPHVAPLGLAFYTGKQFPEAYSGQLFVAEHGSWNRSKKIGYRVSLATIVNNEVATYTPFLEGFLRAGEEVVGRPADIAFLADGSMLVSDDFAGKIYRVSYSAKDLPKKK